MPEETRLPGFTAIHCTNSDHPYGKVYWPAGLSIGYEHTFINLMNEFFNSIETGKQPNPNILDGLQNQVVLAAVERSVLERRWVKIQDIQREWE